jgi:hypothetical protein
MSSSIGKITYGVNEPDRILWLLPPGKPNPREKCIDPEKDNRSRVAQKPQGEGECWYYALRCIIGHVGKDFLPHLRERREIEAKFSLLRKNLSRVIHRINEVATTLKETEKAGQTLSPEAVLPKITTSSRNFKEIVNTLLQMPRSEHAPFLDNLRKLLYYAELKQFVETNLGKKVEDVVEPILLRSGCQDPTLREYAWKEILSSDFNAAVSSLQTAVFHLYATESGLRESAWKADKGIHLLIEELKKHGPMIAGGHIHQDCYTEKPFALQDKVGGHTIHGWRPGTYITNNGIRHWIDVIGAEKQKGQENVFFKDPVDGSDPNDPQKAKIYKISYKRFCEVTQGFCGLKNEPPGYLLYNSRLSPQNI